MAKDFSRRINNLRTRRLGLDSAAEIIANASDGRTLKSESYETRSPNTAVKYVLGAMQAVDPEYTAIGIGEAERVGNQLKQCLAKEGTNLTFDLQGSVPLDLHIRGASDVDLLTFHCAFHTYNPQGVRALAGYYSNPAAYSVNHYMKNLRVDCEDVLQTQFPAVDVDVTGNKAISMSGGSLRRKVDVVPAHWNDTAEYQLSLQKHDRGVMVWQKKTEDTFLNKPFLFMKNINDKDALVGGNLKKSIRLLKNIKKDAEDEGKIIGLTSYDLSSIMWHCNVIALNVSPFLELSLLVVIEDHFEEILLNPELQATMMTPDRSRMIFDKPGKVEALYSLLREVKEISQDVAGEVLGNAGISLDSAQKFLKETAIR